MRLLFLLLFSLSTVFLSMSSHAQKIDSLRNVLDELLEDETFESMERVRYFLSITTEINRFSPSDALIFTESIQELLLRNAREEYLGLVYSYKGNYQWSQGLYAAALKNYFRALDYFEKFDEKEEIIRILNNIGETYKKQKDYEKAAQFLRKALNNIDDSMSIQPYLIQVNIGQLFLFLNKLDSASMYLQMVFEEKESIENENIPGYAYLYQGIIERNRGAYRTSLLYFDSAMVQWEKSNFVRSQVETTLEKAISFNELNETEKARQLLDQMESKAEQIKALDLLMRIYSLRIRISKNTGTKEDVVSNYEKYMQIKDSIFSEEAREEINRLSIQYELAEREKANMRLALEQNTLNNEVKRKNRFLLFLGSIIFLAIAFIILLILQRNKIKSSHGTVIKQKEEIEQKRSELASKSLELAKLNKELYQLNRDLESRIVERSKEVSEKNKKIADYAFFNSHKLRAPVASVLGLINVLEISNDREVNQTVINFLKESALELDEVIKQIRILLEDELSNGIGTISEEEKNDS